MTVESWEEYWRHTGEVASHGANGVLEPVLAAFRDSVFNEGLTWREQTRVLDLACGSGYVLGRVVGAVRRRAARHVFIAGLDGSVAALRALEGRWRAAYLVAGDVRCTPFAERSFDVVLSQFGLEYAGLDAFCAAADLVTLGNL